MKALTFIGKGPYKITPYTYEGHSVKSNLFPVALCEFFGPERLMVFVTKESRQLYWDELCQKLSGKIAPEPVEIPWGGTPDELWEIFDRVVDSVAEGEEVIFDITHGFRSLPFVVFLAVAYLQTVKSIRLRGIVYGAFDARDSEGRAPVFNLSPFLSLLHWLTAVHVFRRGGLAGDLARLLREIQGQAWREGAAGQLPITLQAIGTRIEEVSQALLLIRPLEVMEKAQELTRRLTDDALNEARRWAKPFALIAPAVRREIAPFAVPPSARNLSAQRRMIDWYVERGLAVQALTLARELLVTKACMLLGFETPLQRTARERAEAVLNYIVWSKQSDAGKRSEPWKGSEPPRVDVDRLCADDRGALVLKLWSRIRDNRNDVDHAGMNEQPSKAATLARGVREMGEELARVLEAEEAETPGADFVTIDLGTLYTGVAKIHDLAEYERQALELAGEGRTIVLTGQAPIWMYMRIAHALHGKARRLLYSSPVTGEIVVFNHDPLGGEES